MTEANQVSSPIEHPAHEDTSPCSDRVTNSIMLGAGVGTFVGSIQAAWYPDPITSSKRFGGVVGHTDSKALFRTVARPALFFAITGSTFAFTECAAETFRGLEKKEDGINSLIGGFVTGAVMGATTKRFDIMAASAIGTGLFMWGFAASGNGSVWNKEDLKYKRTGVLPATHKDSDALASLKEKYPKYA